MRFSFLPLLALLWAQPLRADPEPGPQSQSAQQPADEEVADRPLTPAEAAFDEDGDGKLSRRENRRKRRAERRARRRAQGLPDDDQEEVDPAEQARREQRRQAALKRAGAMAQQMKQDTPQDDGGPAGSSGSSSSSGGRSSSASGGGGGGGGSLAASGVANAPSNFHATPGAVTPAAHSPMPADTVGRTPSQSGDPANPRAPEDFLLAVRGGYAPALGKAGLKLSADGRSIVRADGSAATADDYARLGREIRSMPAALSTRPDFFSQVSPAHYGDLKREYSERGPELSKTVFKHVGETEEARDFVHSASCAKLSGECNASVARESYKKGEFVDPKDLDKMWSALENELSEKPAEGGVEDRASASAAAPAPSSPAELPDLTLAPEARPGQAASASTQDSRGTASTPYLKTPYTLLASRAKAAWTGVSAAFSGESTPEARRSRTGLALAGLAVAGVLALLWRRRSSDGDVTD